LRAGGGNNPFLKPSAYGPTYSPRTN